MHFLGLPRGCQQSRDGEDRSWNALGFGFGEAQLANYHLSQLWDVVTIGSKIEARVSSVGVV